MPTRPRRHRKLMKRSQPLSPVRQYVREHPAISWTTLAAVATVLGILGGGVLWLKSQIAMESDFVAHVQHDQVVADWFDVGLAGSGSVCRKGLLHMDASHSRRLFGRHQESLVRLVVELRQLPSPLLPAHPAQSTPKAVGVVCASPTTSPSVPSAATIWPEVSRLARIAMQRNR